MRGEKKGSADAEKSFTHLLTIIPKFGVIYGL